MVESYSENETLISFHIRSSSVKLFLQTLFLPYCSYSNHRGGAKFSSVYGILSYNIDNLNHFL